MILVSCREDFDSNQQFADENLIRRYPNLDDLSTFEALGPNDLTAAVEGKHALVLVHGYRNPLKNVAKSYKRVEQGLTAAGLVGAGGYGEVIGFVWPGFQTALGFFAAVPWANRSASHLRKLLQLLRSEALTIDVETHSLGGRVALQSMAFKGDVWVDNLLLTAPAVDDECPEPKQEFNGSLESCGRLFVYHSKEDEVLTRAYRLASFDRALGDHGPQHRDVVEASCPNVRVIDCAALVFDHGGYRDISEFYAHWARVLSGEPLPRFDKLEKSGPPSLAARGRRRAARRRSKKGAKAKGGPKPGAKPAASRARRSKSTSR